MTKRTEWTTHLYLPGSFSHNLQNSDLRFYSNTRGVTDPAAHAAELHFTNVFFVDLQNHLTFGSRCLRISQAVLRNCRYGDNWLSTKIGKRNVIRKRASTGSVLEIFSQLHSKLLKDKLRKLLKDRYLL